MNPETWFLTIKQKIKPSWVTVFLSVLVFGLAAHAYAFMNYIPNWDSVISYYSDQNTIHLGRCFLTLACGISSYYDLSWVNGMLSLLYLTATAVLICELLSIRKKSTLVLLSALLVTFPSVTGTFGYLYTADGYMLAMLCMTLAIYLTLTYRFGFVPGALLLMFGFGCYQAYITFAAMLVIVYSLSALMYTDTPVRILVWKWLRALACAGTGYALYALANRILLSVQHVTLADYQGVSSLNDAFRTSSGGFAPLSTAKQCLIDFAYFFTGPLHRMNLYSVLNLIMLALLAAGALACIVRKKLWRSPVRLGFTALFALLIPFVCYAIYFLTRDVSYHMLMQGGLYFVYALLLVLYDRSGDGTISADADDRTDGAVKDIGGRADGKANADGDGRTAGTNSRHTRHGLVWQWLCMLVCALIIYNFILISNICYRTQETSVTRSMNEISRLADTIFADDALRECGQIAVIGRRADSSINSLNLPPDMTGFSNGMIMTHALHYSLLLERCHGLSFTPADEHAETALAENPLVREMPCYPAAGSVRAISGTLVIKLSDTP